MTCSKKIFLKIHNLYYNCTGVKISGQVKRATTLHIAVDDNDPDSTMLIKWRPQELDYEQPVTSTQEPLLFLQ